MDLIYMTDVMAYQTIRGPVYDKYNAWEPNNDDVQRKQQTNSKKNKQKEPCKICQERQRRSLMKYIRSKSHSHSDQEIKEEEEEEEEEAPQASEKKEETKR